MTAFCESEKLKVKNEKSNSLVAFTCKHYVCTWIFHSSLFVLHLIILLYSLPSNQQPKGGKARKKNYAGVLG